MKNNNVVGPVSYSSYKQSDVPWLEEVPEHWNVTSFKRIADFKSGAGFPVNEQGHHDFPLPFLKVSDMNLPGNDKLMVNWTNAVTEETAQALGATIFPTGSILFPKVGGAMLTNKRRVTTRNSCIDNNLMSCVVNNGDPNFVLRSLEYLDMGSICKPGPVPAISEGEVREIKIAVPPLDEQAGIVRYLDEADQQIQAYVSAKEKLVTLLEEQRQAIIHRAVTQGLDPNVKLKPSGVEWLGDVPEHWEIQRSKQIFRPRGELAKPDDIQLSATQAYGVIPQDEFEENIGRRVVKISLNLEKRQHVEVDDFVISMRSFQGGLERAWATGCIRSSYVVLSLVREVDTQFFSFLFKSQAYIRALQLTANFIRDGQDLNFNNFSAVDLPVPPIEEQKETGKYLGESTTRIETTISRTRRQIELMEEYRTRLIADVVTGKVDVQNAKVQTPK